MSYFCVYMAQGATPSLIMGREFSGSLVQLFCRLHISLSAEHGGVTGDVCVFQVAVAFPEKILFQFFELFICNALWKTHYVAHEFFIGAIQN